jgi:uncharacterized protein (TIGR02145 family)
VDGDGNTYDTIVIGTQTWLQQNLKTSKYRNGDQIYLISDNEKWISWQIGAYCWYNNDPETYKNTYGALYNWNVAKANICPTGYHVPTTVDWKTLIDNLGGVYDAGAKLKEAGTVHWLSPNVGATNESGFTALPGGERLVGDGSFILIGKSGIWWASDDSKLISLSTASKVVGEPSLPSNFGCSIRCIKDK